MKPRDHCWNRLGLKNQTSLYLANEVRFFRQTTKFAPDGPGGAYDLRDFPGIGRALIPDRHVNITAYSNPSYDAFNRDNAVIVALDVVEGYNVLPL